jgi:predicted  nucleic acid-binding Zn-ribbon protein
MNRKIIINSLLLCLIFSYSLFAQSDYEIVQNFKSKAMAINDSIKQASSLVELQRAQSSIDQLRNKYVDKKELLDKSLYPLDFNKTFENLQAAYDLRKGDFTQIDVLQTQVTGLKEQVDTLNKRNTDLISRVQLLEAESKKDKSRIVQLERSLADLKASLAKRDELVISMIDSLIPPSYRQKSVLSSEEKEKVYSEVEKNSVLNNIKRSLRDNIRFLQVANLNPEDITEIKKQQEQFAKVWKSVGPKLVNVYSEKKAGANDLKDIETYFATWRNALSQEAWHSIRLTFADYGINLKSFSNGKQFAQSATSFIDNEIKNISVKGKKESQNIFKSFADSAWYGEVKPTWTSYLTDNKMFTGGQKDTIENKISEWKSDVYGSSFTWLYYVIGLLIVVIVILIILRRKPKQPTTEA